MTHRSARVLLVFAFCTFIPGRARGDGPLHLIGSAVYELDPAPAATTVARFHITADSDLGDVTIADAPQVVVGSGGTASVLAQAVRPMLVAEKGRHWTLDLTIDGGLLPPAGTFSVHLTISGKQVRAGAFTQALTVQLVRPYAALRLTGTFLATRELSLVGAVDTACDGVTLTETSHRFDALQLSSAKPAPSIQSGTRIAVSVVPTLPERIERGKSAKISCSVEGTTSPGTATGTIVVSGAGLAAPVDVPFEIRTRRTVAWLVLTMVAGLAVGWVLRVGVKDAVARNRARLDVAEALRRVDATIDACADVAAADKLKKLRAELAMLLQEKDPGAAAKKLAAIQDAIDATRRDLDGRLTTVRSAIDASRAVLKRLENLPGSLATAAGKAASAVTQAEQVLASGDARTAQDLLSKADAVIAETLSVSAVQWCDEAGAALKKLSEVIPTSSDYGTADPIEAANGGIDALRSAATSEKDIAKLLEIAHGAVLAQYRVAFAARRGTLAELDAVLTLSTTADDLTELRAHLERLAVAPLTDPVRFLQAVSDVAVHLAQDTRTLVIGILKTESIPVDVANPLGERRLAEAVRAASRVRAAQQEQLYGKRAGPEPELAPAKVRTERALEDWSAITAVLAHGGAEAVRSVASSAGSAFRVPDLPPIVVKTRAALLLAETVQAILGGVLSVTLGLYLFSDGFVGDSRDLYRVFAWGLTADLSLEGLLASLAKIQK